MAPLKVSVGVRAMSDAAIFVVDGFHASRGFNEMCATVAPAQTGQRSRVLLLPKRGLRPQCVPGAASVPPGFVSAPAFDARRWRRSSRGGFSRAFSEGNDGFQASQGPQSCGARIGVSAGCADVFRVSSECHRIRSQIVVL